MFMQYFHIQKPPKSAIAPGVNDHLNFRLLEMGSTGVLLLQ